MHKSTVRVTLALPIPVLTEIPPGDMTVKQWKKTLAVHLSSHMDDTSYTTEELEKMIQMYQILETKKE